MIRFATSMLYRQSAINMGQQQTALVKVQQQMATGNRLLENADDPVASARLLNLKDELGRYDQYERNADLANGRLNIEETALEGAGEILQRSSEFAIQANSGVLNDDNRKAIAGEIRQLRDELLNLANTQDGNGEYLFAGFNSRTQPFTVDATNLVSYQGDQGQRLVKAGPALDVPVSDSGFDVFQNAPTGNTSFFSSFNVAPATANAGNGTIAVGSIVDPNAAQKHDYKITFNAGGTAFDVIDATNNNAPVLTGAPYLSGQPIQFNGLQTSIRGAPSGGENFDIKGMTITSVTGGLTMDKVSAPDPIAFLHHAYEIKFTVAAGPVTTFNVTDVTNNNAPVLTGMTYSAGQTIPFNGLQTAISGTPATNDTFTIQPSRKQDLFKTLDKLATALETSASTPTQAEQLRQTLGAGLSELDLGFDHLTGVRAKLGARMNALDDQQNTNGNFAVHLKKTISEIGDLDYAEAATRLSRETLVLQAAQQSFIKIEGLSLFNYMR
jgi:flagellar hook-associated protein 3 FlgL